MGTFEQAAHRIFELGKELFPWGTRGVLERASEEPSEIGTQKDDIW